MNGTAKPVNILLVDDSPTDADLAIRALSQGELESHVHHVDDGIAAMSFLRHEGSYSEAPRPELILLDLNMPRMDGRQVLAAIQTDESLQKIPVIVLTTSDAEQDVTSAYGLSCNAYIVKPVDVDRFFTVVREIEQFWFRTVRLPRES